VFIYFIKFINLVYDAFNIFIYTYMLLYVHDVMLLPIPRKEPCREHTYSLSQELN